MATPWTLRIRHTYASSSVHIPSVISRVYYLSHSHLKQSSSTSSFVLFSSPSQHPNCWGFSLWTPTIWHAYAGSSVRVLSVNSRVYNFPKAITSNPPPPSFLSSLLSLCRDHKLPVW
ncbi:hypothetical protein CDL15_Pgr009370 [Punica granatum]|uniref:Uncharacterized protein n=1 Tax=Punica granatum TaxID=22663 RepID=A0A218XGR7_PUNGR|nr:hypothetical protein CDL15_Pgr009370 [Punica granatum]